MAATRMGGIQAVGAKFGDVHDGTVTAGQPRFQERSRSEESLLKRLQGAGVLHEVDGGGGAHGAEAFEQAEDEEDQGFVGG